MKIKKWSAKAISYLLSILMITGCLSLPMSVSAATITVTVGVKEGCEDMGSFTINGEAVTSAEVNPGEQVTIEAVPAESTSDFYKYALKKWDNGSTDSTITFTAEEGQTYNFTAEFAKKYYVKKFFYPKLTSGYTLVTVTDNGEYAFAGEEVVVNVTAPKYSVSDFLFYENSDSGTTTILRPSVDYKIEYLDSKRSANITVYNFSPAERDGGLVASYYVGGATTDHTINPNSRISCYVDGSRVYDSDPVSVTTDAYTKIKNSTLVITVKKKNNGYEWLPFRDGYTNNPESFFSVRNDSGSYINLDENYHDYRIDDIDENTKRITVMAAFNSGAQTDPYSYEFRVKEKFYNVEITGYDENGNQLGETKTVKYSMGDGDKTVSIKEFANSQSSVFRDYTFAYWNDDTSLTEYVVDTSSITEDETIKLKANFRKSKVKINVSSSNDAIGRAYINDDRSLKTITVDSGTYVTVNAELIDPYSKNAFTGWSSGNTSATHRVVYHGDMTVDLVANFSGPKEVTVSSSNKGLGLVKVNSGTETETTSDTYKIGSGIKIEAVPAAGKATFVKWSDGVTTNPRVVKVTESGASEYVAEFRGNTYRASISINGNMDYKTAKVTNKADGSNTYSYLDTAVAEFAPGDTVEKWYWEDEVDEDGNPVYHYPAEGKVTREYTVNGETKIKVVSIGKTYNVAVRDNTVYEYKLSEVIYRAGETYETILKSRLVENSGDFRVNPNLPYQVKIGDTLLPDIYRTDDNGCLTIIPKLENVWLEGDMEIIPMWNLAGSEMDNFDEVVEAIADSNTIEDDGDILFRIGEKFSFYINPDESIADVYENKLVPKGSFNFQQGSSGEIFDDWDNKLKYDVVEVGGKKKAKITVPGDVAQYILSINMRVSKIKPAEYLNGIIKIKNFGDDVSGYADSVNIRDGSTIHKAFNIRHTYYTDNCLPDNIILKTKDGKTISSDCYEYVKDAGEITLRKRLYGDVYIEADSKVYLHNGFVPRIYDGYIVESAASIAPNAYMLDKLYEGETIDNYQKEDSNSVEYGKDVVIKYVGSGKFSSRYTVCLDVNDSDWQTEQTEQRFYHVYDDEIDTYSTEEWYDAVNHTITIPGALVAGGHVNIRERKANIHTYIPGTYVNNNISTYYYEGKHTFSLTTDSFAGIAAYLPEKEHIIVNGGGRTYIEGVDYTITRDDHSATIDFVDENLFDSISIETDRTYSAYWFDKETNTYTKIKDKTLYHNTQFEVSLNNIIDYYPHAIGASVGIVKNGKLVEHRADITVYASNTASGSEYWNTFTNLYDSGKGNEAYYWFKNNVAVQGYAVHGDIILSAGYLGGPGQETTDYHGGLEHLTKVYGNCVDGYKTLHYYYCKECGEYYSDSLGKIKINPADYTYADHNIQFIKGHDGVNCLDNGTYDHYECTVCHKKFYDAEAKTNMPNPGKHKYAPYWVWEKKGDTYEYDFTLENRCSLCGHIEETVKADDVTYDKNDQGDVTAHAKAVLFGKTYTLDHTYNVGLTFEVVNGTIVSGKKDSNYTASDRIKVKADAAPSGKVFEGWYEGDTKIASTEEFDYFIDHDAVITAKYSESKPVIVNPVEYSIINNGRKWYNKAAGTTSAKLTFRYKLTEYLNGKHYYIKEAGILRSYTVAEPSFDNYDNSTVVKKVACTNKFNFTFNYTLNMSASKKTSDVYMRGYIKYIDFNTGKEFIAYTDVTKFDAMS